ncbi:MAG: hypothetical protein LBT92_04015 [Rickettsiales bacterium]|jgi:hypothetical protein|nr:hypothetical protein [Rickettsiales bacterium]
MRKVFIALFLAAFAPFAVRAQQVSVKDVEAEMNYRPIVLCRQKGCTEIGDKMTRSYLFNTFANLLLVNDKTKAYLCEADTITRQCRNHELKYALNAGGTAGIVSIPSMTITEVSFSKNLSRITFMLNYDIYLNGLKTFCSTSHNMLDITERKHAMIRDDHYRCDFTSDAPSTAYTLYNIDYVDLDYGIIGAYYSTGITGASSGGSGGYVLIKLQYADIGSNQARIAEDCEGGDCSRSEADYMIAPGQYEILPFVGKEAE